MLAPLILAAAVASAPAATPPKAPAAKGPISCPTQRAIYTYDAAKGFTVTLVEQRPHIRASGLWLKMHSATTRRTYWFEMESGNGYTSIHLIPIKDPTHLKPGDEPVTLPEKPDGDDGKHYEEPDDILGLMQLIPLTRGLKVLDEEPMFGQPAPDRLFMPNLGQALWYDGGEVWGSPAVPREDMPRGFFKLTGCAPRPSR